MSYVALGHRDWARPELAKLAAAAPASALYPYWADRALQRFQEIKKERDEKTGR